jgi:hypothetical protein
MTEKYSSAGACRVRREPIDIVTAALNETLIDEDGESVVWKPLPALSDREIDELRNRLPMPLPAHVERLLRFCRGIEGTAVEELDFTGSIDFDFPEAFPHALAIASDGWGNHWIADLSPASEDFGPIYFLCHDAPIALFQSVTLAEFVDELFKMHKPPHTSLVDDVHEDRLYQVWTRQPGTISQEEALRSPDAEIRAFAATLTASFVIVDLRGAMPGQGFAWGRYESPVHRLGELPVFALKKKTGLLARLLRR